MSALNPAGAGSEASGSEEGGSSGGPANLTTCEQARVAAVGLFAGGVCEAGCVLPPPPPASPPTLCSSTCATEFSNCVAHGPGRVTCEGELAAGTGPLAAVCETGCALPPPRVQAIPARLLVLLSTRRAQSMDPVPPFAFRSSMRDGTHGSRLHGRVLATWTAATAKWATKPSSCSGNSMLACL